MERVEIPALEASLNLDRLRNVEQILEDALHSGQFSGAAWGIVRYGQVVAGGALGYHESEPDNRVTMETLFDIASVTKPLAAAASALYLVDRGELLLGDEVRHFFPEADSRWEGVSLRRLLTHTSGLPPYAALYQDCHGMEAIRDSILRLGPQTPPGERYAYSCLGYILVQHIIQQVTGESLAAFAAKALYNPLGMENTFYCPDEDTRARILPAGACPHRKRRVWGEVHDPLAWAAGGISGNAGLFSSVTDICTFAVMLLNKGISGDCRVLSPAAARLMLHNQLPPELGGHSIGFFTAPNSMLPRGELLPETTVGHTGFTGASLVLVPELQLGVVLLTNCLYHSSDKSAFFRTRRRFHTLVGAAVEG